MYTLGFSFAPWTGKEAIVEGAAILRYLKDVVEQENLDRLIRFDHRVREARWSSQTSLWTLRVDTPAGEQTITCSFLMVCTGYYRYDGGYLPEFSGIDDFPGRWYIRRNGPTTS